MILNESYTATFNNLHNMYIYILCINVVCYSYTNWPKKGGQVFVSTPYINKLSKHREVHSNARFLSVCNLGNIQFNKTIHTQLWAYCNIFSFILDSLDGKIYVNYREIVHIIVWKQYFSSKNQTWVLLTL